MDIKKILAILLVILYFYSRSLHMYIVIEVIEVIEGW